MGTITADRLRELMRYDPETGVFTRIKRSTSGRGGGSVGKAVGTLTNEGYLRIMLDGSRHLAHRLAVLYMTGLMPSGEVDHINGERADNRWSNLRDASKDINGQNRHRANLNNSSGLLGVSFEPSRGKFKAHIQAGGRKRSLGRFSSPEEAHAAYLQAKRVLHAGCTI